MNDADEVLKYKTDPLKVDTDGDGLKDSDEVLKYKTDPLKVDTDGDGLSDGDEVLKYKTNPLKKDTDGGTVDDGTEVRRGTDPLNAEDDVIIITGAAGGIGSGIAKGLDKSGNVLCLCDNNERILKIKSAFKKATLFVRKLDCGVEEDVISFVKEVVKKYKKIDTLVNCAGVVPYFNVEETEYDIFTDTFKSNVGGYFLFSRAVVPEIGSHIHGV